jgi:hypothetical protein
MDEQSGKQKDYQGDTPLPSVVALLAEAASRHAEQGHWDQAAHFARQLLRVTVEARQQDHRDDRPAGGEVRHG